MAVGENQKFLAALITLKTDFDPKTRIPNNILSIEAREAFKKAIGLDLNTVEEAMTN